MPKVHSSGSWGPKYKGMIEDLLREDLGSGCQTAYHCSTNVFEYYQSDPNSFLIKYEDLILDRTAREKLLKYCGLETASDYPEKLAEFDEEIDKSNLYKWDRSLVNNSKANEILSKAAKKLDYEDQSM